MENKFQNSLLVFFLLLNVVLTQSIAYSQSGWFPLPSGTNNSLLSIFFPNVNTGYIVGDLGIFSKTTNGGSTWINQNITPNVQLNSVFFTDVNTGYTCSTDGYIMKTINGGMNWIRQGYTGNGYFNSLYFINSNTGYAVGSEGKIIKTTNGGTNWLFMHSCTDIALNAVYFPSTDVGYAVGGILNLQGIIVKTTNSGTTWFNLLNSGKVLRTIYFINNSTGVTVGGDFERGNVMLKTTNGGENWVEEFSSLNYGTLNGVYFVNELIGYCSGTSGIMKTTNGGQNWFTQYTVSYPFLNSLFMLNESIGYAVGSNGFILKTTNGGYKPYDTATSNYYPLAVGDFWVYENWYYQSGEYHNVGITQSRIITDTVLHNGHKYYIFDQSPSMCGQLHELERIDSLTMNVYWFNPQTGEEELYDSLYSKLNNTYMGKRNCMSDYPIICYDTSLIALFSSTVNSKKFDTDGLMFSEYTLAKNFGFVSYYCTEGNSWGRNLRGCLINGILYGDTTMYYQISGQVTYHDNNQPVPTGYVKALMYDKVTENIITLDSARINNGLYILIHVRQDSLYIMAYGDDEQLDFVPTYYDSTIHWQGARALYPTSNLTNINISVFRINNPGSRYYISGSIFSVNNSFTNEIDNAIIYAKSGNDFKNYSMSDANGFYTVDSLPTGSYELIADRIGYYSDSKFLVLNNNMNMVNFYLKKFAGFSGQSFFIPNSIKLEQNYPNPFNPVTSIKFDIPKTAYVTLVIYDLLGREVIRLIDQQMKPGSYKADWDASNLSSGVYFYKLVTGDFTATKKMALIK